MTEEIVATLVVPLGFAAMWATEARWPARAYVPVSGWSRTGLLFFVLIAATGAAMPLVWDAAGLTSLRVLDLAYIGWWGLPLGVLCTTGANYLWHRTVHYVHALWLATHQLHHSALRVDIPGAFYTHPLEAVAKGTIAVLVGTVGLGLQPVVASAVVSVGALLSLFQHWNVHTPRWLGWFLVRPEMHALHHEHGIHARNYGDLPVWDLLFGTFENPVQFDGRVGFDPAEADRMGDMLLMRDVAGRVDRNTL